MPVRVRCSDDPQAVLDEAGEHLASRPVRHNLVLGLLQARAAAPQPGRYWMAEVDGRVVGVGFQSPLDFEATLTPMPVEAVAALAASIAAEGVRLPGVSGEADVAAAFAGAWTEQVGTGAVPVGGLRLYEAEDVPPPPGAPGSCRAAQPADGEVLVDWVRGFEDETIGPRTSAVPEVVARRTAAGELWVWDDDGPVSMAAVTPPVGGVVRVQYVFTPPERRGHGYASACVAALTADVLAAGHRPVLYTDLGNPVSNRIYRAIGYRAVAECLRYRFP